MSDMVERVARALLIRRLGPTMFSAEVLAAMPLSQFDGVDEAIADARTAIEAMRVAYGGDG